MSELPLVLGLFFASPVALLAGRLLGCATTLVVAADARPPLKTCFNLAPLHAETAVSLAVFSAVSSWGGGHIALAWAGAYAGRPRGQRPGGCAIGLVIAVHDGGLRPCALLPDVVRPPGPAPMVVTLGLVAVIEPDAVGGQRLAALAFGVLLLLAFRAYASLAERHLNLERLYRFSQAVSSAPEIDEVMRNVLGEAKELLRSERAAAAFLGPTAGSSPASGSAPSGQLTRSEEPSTPEDDWVLQHVVEGGQPLLMPRNTRDPDARRWLPPTACATRSPSRSPAATGIVGVLVVADRLGDVRTFEEDDVLLLETVANHAGVALRNGELIGQLRHDALHDALTGLPNRTHLQRRLAARWTTSRPVARPAPPS